MMKIESSAQPKTERPLKQELNLCHLEKGRSREGSTHATGLETSARTEASIKRERESQHEAESDRKDSKVELVTVSSFSERLTQEKDEYAKKYKAIETRETQFKN
jgi:hypothetical protein